MHHIPFSPTRIRAEAHRRSQVLAIALAAVFLVGGQNAIRAEESLNDGARKVGRSVGSVAREVGKGAKTVGKEVGQAAKEGGREFRRAIKGKDSK